MEKKLKQRKRQFRRQQNEVVHGIEDIIEDIPKKWASLNFEPILLEVKSGNGAIRQEPAYILTSDAATLLSMCHTGKKAMQWKIEYINAYNAMEQKLIQAEEHKNPEAEEKLPRVSGPGENVEECLFRLISGMVAYWAFVDGLRLQQAKNTLCAFLGITGFESMPRDKYNDAFSFLVKLAYAPSGGDKPASSEHLEIAHTLIDACSAFKYTCDSDFDEFLEELCGIELAEVNDLTESGVKKVIMTAWSFLNQT